MKPNIPCQNNQFCNFTEGGISLKLLLICLFATLKFYIHNKDSIFELIVEKTFKCTNTFYLAKPYREKNTSKLFQHVLKSQLTKNTKMNVQQLNMDTQQQKFNQWTKTSLRLTLGPFIFKTAILSRMKQAIINGQWSLNPIADFRYHQLVSGKQSSGMLWWCPCSRKQTRTIEGGHTSLTVSLLW